MHRSPSNRKSDRIDFYVTAIEKRYLEACAKQVGLSVAKYMHTMALEKRLKKPVTLPPELLAFKGQLYHLCSVLEPFSHRRLDGEEFNALERAEVKQIIQTVGDLVRQIKNYLQ